MAEDLSAKIDSTWEQLQDECLRFALRTMRLPMLRETDPQPEPYKVQLAAAVIGTFSPAPLGVDDFIGALAVANANAGEDADAVQSPPVFGKPE